MKIKELKEAIKNLPDDMEVIISKDAEGNGYSPLNDFEHNAIYIPDSTSSGEVYYTNWSAEDCCLEEDEWSTMKDEHNTALILAPIN